MSHLPLIHPARRPPRRRSRLVSDLARTWWWSLPVGIFYATAAYVFIFEGLFVSGLVLVWVATGIAMGARYLERTAPDKEEPPR